MKYERYIITNKTRDQFLTQHQYQVRYGTGLDMSKNEHLANQYTSIDDAREDLVNYLHHKKKFNVKMLQIVKVEYIQNDLEVINARDVLPPLPKELEVSLSSYGIDIHKVQEVIKDCKDWLSNKLQETYLVKPTDFTYTIRYEKPAEMQVIPIACIKNIKWEE